MSSPAPRPDRTFADPSGNHFGVKIIYRCDAPAFFFDFSFFLLFLDLSFWLFSSFSSLLSISSYSSLLILLFLSLLILLVDAILCLLSLLLLYFKLLIYTYRSFWGVFRGGIRLFWSIWGATIRPNFFRFIFIFFSSYIFIFFTTVLYSSSSYSSLLIFKLIVKYMHIKHTLGKDT